MLDPRTPFMTALLKSQQERLVSRERIEGLGPVRDAAELVGALRQTQIGAWLEGARWRDAAERDLVLWRYLADTVGKIELRRFFPPDARRFSRAYLFKYDIANVKAVLQGLTLQIEPRLLPIGVLHAKRRLEALAAARNLEQVEDVLTSAGLRPAALIVRSFDPAGSRAARRAVEVALDAHYYRLLRHTASRLGAGHVLDSACGLMLDLANLSSLCRWLIANARGDSDAELSAVRADVLFIPGGQLLDEREWVDAMAHGLAELPRRLRHELHRQAAAEVLAAWERSGSVAVVDEVMERHRLTALHELLAPQVAPAVVMAWFLVTKEIELRNVRLALTAVEDGHGLAAVHRQLLP
jgi:vacuolar-type H+-ATPase subunit C/Vma6